MTWQKAMGSKSWSVPSWSPSAAEPPSKGPGCRAASPIRAPFELASTWLFESAKTWAPSVTRAAMVPAVMAGCPIETPIGTGRGQRSKVSHTPSPFHLAGGAEPGVEAARDARANAHPLELGGETADPRRGREHPDLGLAVGAQGRPAGDDAARGHQNRRVAPLHLGRRAEARQLLGAVSGSAHRGGGEEGGRKPACDQDRNPDAHRHHCSPPRPGLRARP